jgi:hypothetical protein
MGKLQKPTWRLKFINNASQDQMFLLGCGKSAVNPSVVKSDVSLSRSGLGRKQECCCEEFIFSKLKTSCIVELFLIESESMKSSSLLSLLIGLFVVQGAPSPSDSTPAVTLTEITIKTYKFGSISRNPSGEFSFSENSSPGPGYYKVVDPTGRTNISFVLNVPHQRMEFYSDVESAKKCALQCYNDKNCEGFFEHTLFCPNPELNDLKSDPSVVGKGCRRICGLFNKNVSMLSGSFIQGAPGSLWIKCVQPGTYPGTGIPYCSK